MRDVNSLNKVILVGRLGGNPEVRYIPQTDRAVANFSLATNERTFNPNTNESDIRTEWHRIVTWGKLAEFCEKFLTKGKQILVEGRIRTEKWQDKEGNPRYTTKVHAQTITLLGKKEDSDLEAHPDQPTKPEEDSAMPEAPNTEDDDIPF